jgi:hypothetical protein
MLENWGSAAATKYRHKLWERGVSLEKQEVKMNNLTQLALSGFRVFKAIKHDKYKVTGKEGYYNPYKDLWF